MILRSFWEQLMIKRQTLAACNGRFRKRRSSAIRTLVAETLVLAKTHGYVEKIESELEEELARDTSEPPKEILLRWRQRGDKVFKSKHMLITVVILCIVDCALVLGELALDLYKVKATLEGNESITGATETFMSRLRELYPSLIDRSPYKIFNMLLQSVIVCWGSANHTSATIPDVIPIANLSSNFTGACSTCMHGVADTNITTIGEVGQAATHDTYDLEVVGDIAHVFHYCSIAILGLIMIETYLKAICAGMEFFHRKLEVFDAFIVVMSFIVDFCFLVFLSGIDTKDFVFILAILLPWRVIRVVNSLVVSVKDHEHFRLKLVYKRKKKIQGNLRDTEAMLQKYMAQVTTLQRLCIMEGIEEWKVDSTLRNEEATLPNTPNKKRFKFKFHDDSIFNMQGHNRAPRCSMPSLDFHGLKLPANGNVSKSRISLPSVANTIKSHLKNRRASMAASDILGTKISNGDVKRKRVVSDDLCTMHEEDIDINRNSAMSSRATSESGDVFSRLPVDGILDNKQISNTRNIRLNVRQNSDSADSEDGDEMIKLAKIKEDAKRRHSESVIDKRLGFDDLGSYNYPNRKYYSKPMQNGDSSVINLSPGSTRNQLPVVIDLTPAGSSEGKNFPTTIESTADIEFIDNDDTDDDDPITGDPTGIAVVEGNDSEMIEDVDQDNPAEIETTKLLAGGGRATPTVIIIEPPEDNDTDNTDALIMMRTSSEISV